MRYRQKVMICVVKSSYRNTLAVGFDGLVNGGTSRNSAKNAAFLIQPPVLVARMGGRKPCWLAPAVPSLSTRSSCRPHLTVSAPVFKPERSRYIMAISLAPIGGSLLIPEILKAARPCVKCGATGRTKNGNCKACAAAYQAANSEKIRAVKAAYQAANSDKLRASAVVWLAENLDRNKAYKAEWYTENRERLRVGMAAWRKANPEARRISRQNRDARKNKTGGQLSKGLATKLFKLQKGKCPCCAHPLGDDYHLDHKMPLALGGSNTDDNMQLLRARCNKQKGAKDPLLFMQSRGFLL